MSNSERRYWLAVLLYAIGNVFIYGALHQSEAGFLSVIFSGLVAWRIFSRGGGVQA